MVVMLNLLTMYRTASKVKYVKVHSYMRKLLLKILVMLSFGFGLRT